MPRGRPTKYRPEFCDQVIELGKEGKSVAQMCSHFEIARGTIDLWAQNNPDFMEAFTRARTEMQAKLEDIGFRGFEDRNFNANLWIKTMQARFRDDYTERQALEHTGKDGGPIETKPADIRETARAILAVLGKVKPETGAESTG